MSVSAYLEQPIKIKLRRTVAARLRRSSVLWQKYNVRRWS